ncbi:putative bifunctional diguanylate cyclase/phosphodiesterase [Acidocella aromatica]|uniref:Diguanylate cyclase (GGDEF)-like protein n=1 Tax=Acidocella aromatica TaxID=1303579 RepID=A0A840VPH8_9PROT|nr:EAL domain-containing protein [Acidocella aromatica]MBB5373310.1 diguanylate cyclase (GGDEF)-like protein [Acidocella aromatica]
MIHGSPNQRALIYGVAIGCIATPVLVSPSSSAISYWLPISIGVCISLCFNRDLYALTDLLSFIMLTGFCILYINRRLNERAVGAIRLEENAEVIKLLLRDFEESASDWLWETNAALELQPPSQRLAQVVRRPAEQLRGPFPAVLLGESANKEQRPGSAMERLNRAIAERSPFRDLVVPVTINGEERYWSLTGKPFLDKHGRFAGYHGVGSDITGQRRQQEQISFLARHDSLTKLPNRVLFSETLHESCERCENTGIALLCLDLDNFKIVNDTLGHATGDALLVAVAERLRGCIREFDMATRLGGDEFATILVTDKPEEALAVARRIIERMTRPFQFDGQIVKVGISIGVAMAPRDGKTPTKLMKNADLALYRAKEEGRGTVRFYDPEMDERVRERRALQSALHRALAQGEFRLDYQPVIDLATRRIAGAEALIRWQHPERGLLPPSAFIPLAEDSGFIREIGEWVLHEACTTAAAWPEPAAIAVNLSPLQFRDPKLATRVSDALASSRLAPGRLEVEIVESVMLDTDPVVEQTLRGLRAQGVRIALDDFGTGYSSLSYLRRFPFDKLKIDRSFIRDLGQTQDASAIILAIIGLAQRMNMVVTAEGVETTEQATLLSSFGCAQAQGYLFHRPMSSEAFSRLLAQNPPHPARPPAA